MTVNLPELQARVLSLTLEQRRAKIRELLQRRQQLETARQSLADDELAFLNLLLAAAELPANAESEDVRRTRREIQEQLSKLNGDPAAYQELAWESPTIRIP